MDNNTPGTSLGGSSKGGFSIFGGASPEYSNTELAGIPLTGMSPLSPYLNVDPRYLTQDTDDFILPTGANKTRGRFELAFFTIGGSCITGAVFGSITGIRMGLSETKDMAWSKPRNVQFLIWTQGVAGGLKPMTIMHRLSRNAATNRVTSKLNWFAPIAHSVLNLVTRQGATWANTLGSVALLYSAFGVAIEKARGAEDDINTVAAGTLTGMLYKSTGGFRAAARGGLVGLALSGAYALYSNWDHLKGHPISRY